MVEVAGINHSRRETSFIFNGLCKIASKTDLQKLSTLYTTLYKILQLFHLQWNKIPGLVNNRNWEYHTLSFEKGAQ